MARALVPLLLLLLALLAGRGPQPAAALRCYACAPISTKGLQLAVRLALSRFPLCDNFNPRRPQDRFVMDCPSLSNACLKTKTFRTCFVSRHKQDRCKGDRCTCTTSLCNSGPSGPVAVGWLLVTSLGITALRGGLQQWW